MIGTEGARFGTLIPSVFLNHPKKLRTLFGDPDYHPKKLRTLFGDPDYHPKKLRALFGDPDYHPKK
ncbi:hypothetical protein GCM10007096_21960 [Pullulanibacillus pueri]|uniref:Uncharacterized protein n=1 Tax=Pullulanibacillus pueri TaxID=1437324 RepID=A0A8J3EM83_9BACL|nr:hypothetical protein GCM10007096_21960 [Pullulanibacillus pueri]